MSTKRKVKPFVYITQIAGLKIAHQKISAADEIYLFLNEEWYADAWINGGKIPIALASAYRDVERKGTKTPDENVIHQSPVDLNSIPGVEIRGKNITILDMRVEGVQYPPLININYYEEDGVVLCFCKSSGKDLAEKFGGKKVCLKINNVSELKKIIDAQIGVIGKFGECSYTHGHQRNHFLKSALDSWQQEIRLFWSVPNGVEIILPSGVATLVEYYR